MDYYRYAQTPNRRYIEKYFDRTFAMARPASPMKDWMNGICSQAGLGWLNGADASYFPYGTYAAAITRFRIAALDGVADLGVTLGELRQTAGFVTDLCRGVEGAVYRLADESPRDLLKKGKESWKEYRKRKARRVAGLLKTGRPQRRALHETRSAARRRIRAEKKVLSAWLTVQFALKPLMGDLVSAAEALDYWKNERQMPFRLTVRKGAEGKDVRRVGITDALAPGITCAQRFDVETSSRCHISGTFSVPPSSNRTLRQLGLANPALVVWEKSLFSWLVDYGLGVGNWLKSMTSLDHMEWEEGCVSYLAKLETTTGEIFFSDFATSQAWLNGIEGQGRIFVKAGRFSRVVLQNTPLPAYMPVPKKQLGLTQMANAMSALAGLTDTRGLRI